MVHSPARVSIGDKSVTAPRSETATVRGPSGSRARRMLASSPRWSPMVVESVGGQREGRDTSIEKWPRLGRSAGVLSRTTSIHPTARKPMPSLSFEHSAERLARRQSRGLRRTEWECGIHVLHHPGEPPGFDVVPTSSYFELTSFEMASTVTGATKCVANLGERWWFDRFCYRVHKTERGCSSIMRDNMRVSGGWKRNTQNARFSSVWWRMLPQAGFASGV
jgi:hypothetical protein